MSPASPITLPQDVALDPARPLAIIDVDEVLALFVQGFRAWLAPRGVSLRMETFALFGNMHEGGAVVDKVRSKALLDGFFAEGCGEIEPAPGAIDGLAALSDFAQVVILTNAPEAARAHRVAWMARHGLAYPLILNEGPKGPAVAVLSSRVQARSMFVDDILSNLDSVAEAAPSVERYQMVADADLRRMAPASPRHTRIDQWPDLVAAAERALRV